MYSDHMRRRAHTIATTRYQTGSSCLPVSAWSYSSTTVMRCIQKLLLYKNGETPEVLMSFFSAQHMLILCKANPCRLNIVSKVVDLSPTVCVNGIFCFPSSFVLFTVCLFVIKQQNTFNTEEMCLSLFLYLTICLRPVCPSLCLLTSVTKPASVTPIHLEPPPKEEGAPVEQM